MIGWFVRLSDRLLARFDLRRWSAVSHSGHLSNLANRFEDVGDRLPRHIQFGADRFLAAPLAVRLGDQAVTFRHPAQSTSHTQTCRLTKSRRASSWNGFTSTAQILS